MNSTNMIQNLHIDDYESGNHYKFSQVIRHNGTDFSHALYNFDGLQDDMSLELHKGMEHKSYSTREYDFTVNFVMDENEPGVFYQYQSAGEVGICVNQRVDLYKQTWDRTIYVNKCKDEVYRSSWKYPKGDGPITEPVVNTVTIVEV